MEFSTECMQLTQWNAIDLSMSWPVKTTAEFILWECQ